MQTFAIGTLAGWENVAVGELIKFPVQRQRRIEFDVMASDIVNVWASEDGGQTAVLVGVGGGRLNIRFAAAQDVEVYIDAGSGDEDPADVFVKLAAGDHRYKPASDTKFTNVEPRARRNPEFDQIATLMRLNQERMNKEMAALRARDFVRDEELKALKSAAEKPPVKGEEPKAEPEKAKEPKSEGKKEDGGD